jgi:hypothetical protein
MVKIILQAFLNPDLIYVNILLYLHFSFQENKGIASL